MHAVDLIASALKNEALEMPRETTVETCCLTGEVGHCVFARDAIGAAFTNRDLLKAPTGKYISLNAYIALKYKWERMSSWVCDGETFTRLDRQGVRISVFGETPKTPWVGYATTSYKKHGSLWTPVNSGLRRVWRFEMLTVDLTDGSYRNLYESLCEWQKRGVGRMTMESMEPNIVELKNIGVKTWLEFCEFAESICNSPTWKFMCYLLPSREELKNEQA